MPGLSTPPSASGSLRVLAALLGYPDARQYGHLQEMRAILRSEAVLSVSRLAEIEALIDALSGSDHLQTEADYVELFDRNRATSLHLFEHVHGDSRDRGPAMIDLAKTYEQAGLYLAAGELPDYLPVVIEFASMQPPRQARAFLEEMAHILNALFNALQQRASAYASVLGALLDLAGSRAQPVKLAAELPLDESWEEPAVFDGCTAKGQTRPGQAQAIHIVRKDAQTGVVA